MGYFEKQFLKSSFELNIKIYCKFLHALFYRNVETDVFVKRSIFKVGANNLSMNVFTDCYSQSVMATAFVKIRYKYFNKNNEFFDFYRKNKKIFDNDNYVQYVKIIAI